MRGLHIYWSLWIPLNLKTLNPQPETSKPQEETVPGHYSTTRLLKGARFLLSFFLVMSSGPLQYLLQNKAVFMTVAINPKGPKPN